MILKIQIATREIKMMKTNYTLNKVLNKKVADDGIYTIHGVEYYFVDNMFIPKLYIWDTVIEIARQMLDCGYSEKIINAALHNITMGEAAYWLADRSCVCHWTNYDVGKRDDYKPGAEQERIYDGPDRYSEREQIANVMWHIEWTLTLDCDFNVELIEFGFDDIYVFGYSNEEDYDDDFNYIVEFCRKHLLNCEEKAYLESIEEVNKDKDIADYWEDFVEVDTDNWKDFVKVDDNTWEVK